MVSRWLTAIRGLCLVWGTQENRPRELAFCQRYLFVNAVIISFIWKYIFWWHQHLNHHTIFNFPTQRTWSPSFIHFFEKIMISWYHDIDINISNTSITTNISNLPRSVRWTWWRERSFVFSSSRTRPLFRYSCLADFWWPFNWHCSDGQNDYLGSVDSASKDLQRLPRWHIPWHCQCWACDGTWLWKSSYEWFAARWLESWWKYLCWFW